MIKILESQKFLMDFVITSTSSLNFFGLLYVGSLKGSSLKNV